MKAIAYFKKITFALFHPFHNMPVPDFNNKYDETML